MESQPKVERNNCKYWELGKDLMQMFGKKIWNSGGIMKINSL